MAVCTGVCAVLQVVLNNRGLNRYPPLVLVPVYSSVFVLSNAAGGGIFFKDFENLTSSQIKLYGAGVTLVVLGVLLIARAAAIQQVADGINTKKHRKR